MTFSPSRLVHYKRIYFVNLSQFNLSAKEMQQWTAMLSSCVDEREGNAFFNPPTLPPHHPSPSLNPLPTYDKSPSPNLMDLFICFYSFWWASRNIALQWLHLLSRRRYHRHTFSYFVLNYKKKKFAFTEIRTHNLQSDNQTLYHWATLADDIWFTILLYL